MRPVGKAAVASNRGIEPCKHVSDFWLFPVLGRDQNLAEHPGRCEMFSDNFTVSTEINSELGSAQNSTLGYSCTSLKWVLNGD